jgi:hypothetical protein
MLFMEIIAVYWDHSKPINKVCGRDEYLNGDQWLNCDLFKMKDGGISHTITINNFLD